MKKIIVGFFALAVIFTAHSAFASGPFNGQSGDCSPTIGIGNYTDGNIPRDSYGCWTAGSISAGPGDTINVGMYYHNNTNSTLTNVRAVVTKSSSGPANSYSFTGSMSSNQGSQTFGTVTLNLSSSETLTYSSTHLMKGKTAVLSDTDTLVVQNEGGIDVGSVPPGWNDYGTIVVVYKVGTNNNGGTCQDTSASNYGGSLPCQYYTQDNCTISNFTIDGSTHATVDSGDRVNLDWDTNNCTSVYVSGPDFSSSSLDGDRNIYPTRSGTYTINAYGSNGSNRTRTVYVTVDENNDNYCRINSFTANGSNQVTIQSGNAVNLYWDTTDCTSVYVSGPGINSSSRNSNQTVYPTNNSNYTITAYGNNGGNQTRTVYVNVNQVIQPPILPVYNTCAVTTVATNTTTNSAVLNGLITNSTGASYFEYGRDVTLGSRTVARVGSGAFSEAISGLTSNTNYYFRFVSQCIGGMSYGSIETFRTGGTVRPVVIQGTTVIGTQSPIMLEIENRFQYVGIGDIVDYTVKYKNIGKTTLTRPVLQVVVPKGFTLINASRGTFSQETNTLTVPLEDLLPGAEGIVYLQARAESIESSNAQIVTTAILVYTNPSGAQENAIAYVLNSPRNGNVLGASAFWSGFWDIGLIGWLLILILILLIILATRSYRRKSTIHTTNPVTGGHTTTTNY